MKWGGHLFRKRASQPQSRLPFRAGRAQTFRRGPLRVKAAPVDGVFVNWEAKCMEVKHCCADCGEVIVVHEHSSWQEIKDCDRNRRALCVQKLAGMPAAARADARTGEVAAMTLSRKSDWPFVFVAVAAFNAQPDTVIHEGGHLAACYLQGDRSTCWNPITPWVHAETECTNQNTALFTAGGTFTSLLVWTIFTMIFAVWLSRRRNRTARPWVMSLLWLEWSLFCLGELVPWAWQAREYPAINDSARFVAATGIDPGIVIRASLALLFVLVGSVFLPAVWRMRQAFRISPTT